jgi:hypothetical protein
LLSNGQQQQQQQHSQTQSSQSNKLHLISTEQLVNIARNGGAAGMLALTELQRRSAQLQSEIQQRTQQSSDNTTGAGNLLAAVVQNSSSSALQRLVQNASGTFRCNLACVFLFRSELSESLNRTYSIRFVLTSKYICSSSFSQPTW